MRTALSRLVLYASALAVPYPQRVRISYDPEADAAYISLTDEPLMPGRDSIPCETPDDQRGAIVVMDWKNGKIVGLEVLDASSLLHADLLARAHLPGGRQTGSSPSET
jgi:uncharacterized protein YuzE